MGMQHPNPDVPPMQMATSTRALAQELGLTGKHVFFNDGWVEYAQRQNYLMEATLGVTAHFDSAETRFAFRTRALDYLWATLPVVTTEGDWFAELVDREGLGLTVPPEDPGALADALYRLLSDPGMMQACREHASSVRTGMRWSVVLEPLAAFCRHPRRAPDLPLSPPPTEPAAPIEPGPTTLVELARHHYREGGLLQVVRRAASKAQRLARDVALGKDRPG
jgi:hypothetical protein